MSDLPATMRAVRPLSPGKDGRPAPWLYEWEHPDALPSQVRVRIADAQGAWPDMVVALPQSSSYGVAPEDAK